MTRIAIIGNSHLAALRKALVSLAPAPAGIEITAVAAPNTFQGDYALRPDGTFGPTADAPRKVVAQTRKLNGRDTISLAEHDHVLVIGLPNGIKPLLKCLDRADVDGLREVGAAARLSAAAFAAFLEANAQASRLPPVWQDFAGRLTLALAPRPCETLLHPKGELAALAADPAGLGPALDRQVALVEARFRDMGFRVVGQRPDTLGRDGLTARRWSVQGPAPAADPAADPADDHTHMNADYGALVWRDLLVPFAQAVPA